MDTNHKAPPICLLYGYGGGAAGYLPLIQNLRDQGNEVLGISSVRKGGTRRSRQFPSTLVRQAERVISTLKDEQFHQGILLGHSMGAAVALVAAAMAPPGMFKRVICLCPAGVIPDTVWRLSWRMARKRMVDTRRAKRLTGAERQLWELTRNDAKNYRHHSWGRTVHEGIQLGRFHGLPLVAQYNINAYFVSGTHDRLFKPDRIATAVAELLGADRHIELPISHDPHYKRDEAQIVAQTLHEHGLLS